VAPRDEPRETTGAMPESELVDKRGISRRQLLARGAVAAGVAWAAPVIRMSTAYAAASDGTERPATRFFAVAIDATNTTWSVFPTGGADLPASWQPEAVGNGWAQPWDGQGEPPWGQTTSQPASTKVYTYNPPAVVAGPGQSVSFGRRGTVDSTGDAATVDGTPVDDATVAADDPEMPDVDQFSQRIGADLPDPLPPPVVDWVYANPGIELEAPDRRPALTQVGDSAWACLLPAPPALPDWWSRRYRLILGCYKDGNYFGSDGYEDPNASSAERGRRVIFPTVIERVGGYSGRSGRPGVAGPDQASPPDNASTRVGGPGAAVPAAAQPVDPAQPNQPAQPDQPTSGSSSTSTSTTTTTTRPGTTPAWDPASCTPDPKAVFPWNLPYPQNFVVAWYGPRYGLKIPKAPKSACLPPPPPKDPKDTKGGKDTASGSTTSTSSTTTTTRPSGGDDQPAADSTTTTTTTAPPAPAAPQAPTSEIKHQATRKAKKIRYPHTGHLGDHECIVLIYCRP